MNFRKFLRFLISLLIFFAAVMVDAQENPPVPQDSIFHEDEDSNLTREELLEKKWALEEENDLLRSKLYSAIKRAEMNRIEETASDLQSQATGEKANVFTKKAELEKTKKEAYQKRMEGIRKSFYFPGAARYERGDFWIGFGWSVGFFGMVGADMWAYGNVAQKKAALDSVAPWDYGALQSRNTAYASAFETANLLYFVTALVYVLNLVDAAYWLPDPEKEIYQGTVTWELKSSKKPLAWYSFSPSQTSFGNQDFQATLHY